MATSQFWMIWPGNPALSILILFIVSMPFLYAARMPLHGLIRSLGHVLSNPLRLAAAWLSHTALDLKQRNQAVLLAHGSDENRRLVEREFERVGALVKRDLQGYPAVQRKLLDEITRLEEDYKKCGEVPPSPPDWTDAVTAISTIKSGASEVAHKILAEINSSINQIHDKALSEYRNAYKARHAILKTSAPFWRSIDKTMNQVETTLGRLQESTGTIDNKMDKYEQIVAKTDHAKQTLAMSSFTQFAISSIVMLIALGGAFVNFKLIALPMSEMVGSTDYITGSLRTSEVAALVIIMIEAAMGLFLMESLRITRLFPTIAQMNDQMRRRMIWIALTLLIILASIEASLALMRDMLMADKQALLQSLANVAGQAHSNDSWMARIPTAGQMILGFILPFTLAFVAIPLESFIHSARTVLGALLVVIFRSLSFALRFLSMMTKQASRALVKLYDVFIVLPLLAERLFGSKGSSSDGDASDNHGQQTYGKSRGRKLAGNLPLNADPERS